jgi:hypothetical protein
MVGTGCTYVADIAQCSRIFFVIQNIFTIYTLIYEYILLFIFSIRNHRCLHSTVGANRLECRRRKVRFLKIAITLVQEQISISHFF